MCSIHYNLVYNAINCLQVDGNELDDIYLKMVCIHTIENEFIQRHNQITFLVGLCVAFYLS